MSTRLTFGQSFAISPIWSPGADRLVFGLNRDGRYDLYAKPANGARDEEAVLKSIRSKRPTSWRRNGRFLLDTETDPATRNDVWVLPLEGRKPIPFLRSGYNEDQGQFTSDGRFVADVSDESGRSEVYVREFPAAAKIGGGTWLVSTAGGSYAPMASGHEGAVLRIPGRNRHGGRCQDGPGVPVRRALKTIVQGAARRDLVGRDC